MDPFETLKISVIECLDKSAATGSQEYQSLKDKYEKLQISSTKTNDECKTLRTNLISANEKNESLRNDFTALNQKSEDFQKQLNETQKQLTEAQKQLTGLKKRNEELQKELTASESSMNVVLNKNADMEVSLREARTEIKEIKNKLSLVSDSKSKLETKLQQERNKNAKLAKRLEEYKKIPETITNALSFINKTVQHSEISEDEDSQQSASENVSTTDGRDGNRSSPALVDNIPRTRSGSKGSPKKEDRILSNPVSISPKPISLENLYKDKPTSAEVDKEKTTQSSFASNINAPASQPNQPTITVSSPKDNRNLRRSPLPGVSFATPISSSVDVEREKRSSPVTATVKPNQTNSVVSLRRDSPDPVRSPSLAIPMTPNNLSKVVSVSTEASDRSPSPSFGGLQNRSNQPKSILSAKSDNHTDCPSPLRSILVISGASAAKEKEEINQKLMMESAMLASSSKRDTPLISVKSDDQLKAKPASIDATKETNRSSPLTIRIPSNQTISSASPTGDTRNLRRGSISPIAAISKNQSTAKIVSINDPKDYDNRPAVITGAQNNQIITTITPNKNLRSLSPRPGSPSVIFSPKTPSKILANAASGNKERDIHLSRSSLLISRAQETQREADNASRGDNQTGSQPTADSKPPSIVSENASQQTMSPLLNTEVPPASHSRKDTTNETSTPEYLITELFPGLQNTPRRSLTDSEDSNNSRNVRILYEESDADSQSSSARSIPDTSSSNIDLTSLQNKFPIVCLSRVEIPEKLEQTPQDSKKSRKSFQEDLAGVCKRRMSVSEHTPKRRKSNVEDIAAVRSPRVPRQIKQKLVCLICKKQTQSNSQLDEHILRAHPNLNSIYVRCPYTCNNGGECRRHYTSLKNFRQHVLLRHPAENPDIEFTNQWYELWSCLNWW